MDTAALTREEAAEAKAALMQGATTMEVARKWGVSPGVVKRMRLGQSYRDVKVLGFEDWVRRQKRG